MLEPAELAAGLPLALSFALAGAFTTLREGRRRSSLNEAMHELRRPLQVLALALPQERPVDTALDSSLRLVTAALERLDREINGIPEIEARARFSPHSLLAAGVARWKSQAVRAGGDLELVWKAGEVCIEGNPDDLAQALDNLIINGIEHGGGKVTVEGRVTGSWLTISVCDAGGAGDALPVSRRRGRRRGHGLRVVARVAHAHGGSFGLRRRGRYMEAKLQLPLPVWEERV